MTLQDVLIEGEYILIDVREPMELEMDGYIQGAINIPLGEIENKKDEILAYEVPVVFFCRSGNRSGKALEYMIEQGLENGYNGGGFSELQYTLDNL